LKTFENVLFQVPSATPSMVQFDSSRTPGLPSRRGPGGPGGGGSRASTRLESPSSPPSWQNSKVLHIVTLRIECNYWGTDFYRISVRRRGTDVEGHGRVCVRGCLCVSPERTEKRGRFDRSGKRLPDLSPDASDDEFPIVLGGEGRSGETTCQLSTTGQHSTAWQQLHGSWHTSGPKALASATPSRDSSPVRQCGGLGTVAEVKVLIQPKEDVQGDEGGTTDKLSAACTGARSDMQEVRQEVQRKREAGNKSVHCLSVAPRDAPPAVSPGPLQGVGEGTWPQVRETPPADNTR
jgi:hypothetical protein